MKNIKQIILGLFLILTVSLNAQNYSFFENDVRYDEHSTTVTLTHFGEFGITQNFGFSDYVSVENNQLGVSYGQVLLGVNYKAIENVTFSIFAGKETLTNSHRMAAYTSYLNGDKLFVYAFYQKNPNETYDSEFYDLRLRYATYSGNNNSVYVGVRYMRYYGVGLPIGLRQTINDNCNLYVSYTTYYNAEVGQNYKDSSRWTPTFSLNLELF